MPKRPDFSNVSQVPVPAFARFVGPGPLKHADALKAVVQHINENNLWGVPGKIIYMDARLMEALECPKQIHILELPKIVGWQLKPVAEEVAALKAQFMAEVKADPLGARWLEGDEFEDPCVSLDEAALEGLTLDERTRSFLLRVGLPESAAPFIDFDVHREGAPLEDLGARTGREEDRGLRIVGVYGDMDEQDQLLCLDERHGGRIVVRNPEKGSAPVLMNSGVHELLECLMVYRDALKERTQGEIDEEVLLPRRLHAKIAAGIQARDPQAFQPGTFWYTQVGSPVKPPKKKPAAKKKAAAKKKPAAKKKVAPKKPAAKKAPKKAGLKKKPAAKKAARKG